MAYGHIIYIGFSENPENAYFVLSFWVRIFVDESILLGIKIIGKKSYSNRIHRMNDVYILLYSIKNIQIYYYVLFILKIYI